MSKREHNTIEQLLPEGYRPLEYIESTGTQYIDTNLLIDSDDVIKVKFNRKDGKFIYGNQTRNSDRVSFAVVGEEGYYDFGNDTSNRLHGGHFPANVIYNLIMGNRYVKDADTMVNILQGTPVNHFTRNFTYYLCRLGSTSNYASVVYYLFEVVGKRNMIPALRISDNKPGLYDLCGSICPLTGTPFYINAGTGEFLYN